MYCTYCGAKINDDSVFCPHCGAEIIRRSYNVGDEEYTEAFPDDDTLTPDPEQAYQKAENAWWKEQQERMREERAQQERARQQQAQMNQDQAGQYDQQYDQYDPHYDQQYNQQYGQNAYGSANGAQYDPGANGYSGIRNPYGFETIDPVHRLGTNFTLLKFVFLGLITIGIYDIVILSIIGNNINKVAGPYDGRETMHYCLIFFIFSWLTFGIVPLVWYHRLSNRVGEEQFRRTGRSTVGAVDFWLWGVLGCLIIVGPFIYYWKLLHAMNDIDAHYNVYR